MTPFKKTVALLASFLIAVAAYIIFRQDPTPTTTDTSQNTANTSSSSSDVSSSDAYPPNNYKPQPVPISPPDQSPQPETAITPPPAADSQPISPDPQPAPTYELQPAPQMIVTPQNSYKDGVYTGNDADAYYGNVQVRAVIQGGKITDVQFLDYPHDRGTSVQINSQATPYLRSEAIQAQNANVDIVSGATQTRLAFQQSLATALSSAR